MFQSAIADTLCSDATQGEGEQELALFSAGSASYDISIDPVGGKSPAFAWIVIQQAQVNFPKRFRQFVIPRRCLQLPTLFEGPVYGS